jgi:hypothetical protein
MTRINYTDKIDAGISPTPANQKISAGDMNEIKSAVNGIVDGHAIRLNGGSALPQRGTINFIEGANVSMAIADNPGQQRTDVTIASTGGGGGSGPRGYLGVTTWRRNNLVADMAYLTKGMGGIDIGAGLYNDYKESKPRKKSKRRKK